MNLHQKKKTKFLQHPIPIPNNILQNYKLSTNISPQQKKYFSPKLNQYQLNKKYKEKVKSFRSKMFQKRALKAIPTIGLAHKQITIHQPPLQNYLNQQINFDVNQQVPQLWGCIDSQPKKIPKIINYLQKRRVYTPDFLLTNYMKRKSLKTGGYQELSQNQQNQSGRANRFIDSLLQKHKKIKNLQYLSRQNQKRNLKPLSLRKTQKQTMQQNLTERFHYRNNVQNDFFNLTNFSSTNYQITKFNQSKNKSLHQMNIQELEDSIQWKKRLLNILTQSLKTTKEKY